MPRKRSIKPGYIKSRTTARLTIGARYLDVALWCHLDGNGMVEDCASLIKSMVFPRDKDLEAGEITKFVQELVTVGRLHRIDVDGKWWLFRRNFRKEQRVYEDEPKEVQVDRTLLAHIDEHNTLPPVSALFPHTETPSPSPSPFSSTSTFTPPSTSSSTPGLFDRFRAMGMGTEEAGELARVETDLQRRRGVSA